VINGMTRGIERTVVNNDHVLQKLAGKLLSRVDLSKHHLSPVVKCCFFGERGFPVPTKFFCSFHIYGRC